MKPFGWQWLAISSLIFGSFVASAKTRPQYGGTLHVMMRAAPSSLDPAELMASSAAARNVIPLIFDTLVAIDAKGQIESGLAESWQTTRGNQRLQMRLRQGVKFHDGTALTAEVTAASLRRGNPSWKVFADGDSVIIESESPDSDLLQELALARNAIAKKGSENSMSGTGPFRFANWEPGRRLSLSAYEDCWRGRPFLDSIEIGMGKSFREQMTALELGKADLVEIAPEQMHHVSAGRYAVVRSAPVELLALRFASEAASADERAVREALRLCIERSSIHSVLLQGAGEATAGILPNWMSGYGFVFSTTTDLSRARQMRDQVKAAKALTIGYDNSDPLSRLVAERVALNAKDARIMVQPMASGSVDVRVLRIPLDCCEPWTTLKELAETVGLQAVQSRGHSLEDVYAAEQTALATERLVPLFHLPLTYASTLNARGWIVEVNGMLDLSNAWLKSEQP